MKTIEFYNLPETVQDELKNFSNLYEVSEDTFMLETSMCLNQEWWENSYGVNHYLFISVNGEYLMETHYIGYCTDEVVIEKFGLEYMEYIQVI